MNIDESIKINNALERLKECKISKEDGDIIYNYIIELEKEYDRLYEINKVEVIKRKMLIATYIGKDSYEED